MLAVAAEGLKGRVRWIIPGVILTFNFAALQHNLGAWEYASERAKTASAVVMNCISSGTKEIVVLGLPGRLRGVPFFANGFPESIELRRKGTRIAMESPGKAERRSPNEPSATQRLIWDGTEDEILCIGRRYPSHDSESP